MSLSLSPPIDPDRKTSSHPNIYDYGSPPTPSLFRGGSPRARCLVPLAMCPLIQPECGEARLQTRRKLYTQSIPRAVLLGLVALFGGLRKA